MDWLEIAAAWWVISQAIGLALAFIIVVVGIIYVVVQTLRGH
jgi:hypothetical protein